MADERYTVRDGINIGRYAMKLMSEMSYLGAWGALEAAVLKTLGEEALRYAPRVRS
jgi:hypothetical protein